MRTLVSIVLSCCLPAVSSLVMAATSVQGTVQGPSGGTVPGAQVDVYWRTDTGFDPSVRTSTNADGVFSVSGPDGAGFGFCVISAKGLAFGGGSIGTKTPNEYRLLMPASLSGSVVDGSGAPVSDAVVKVTGISSVWGGNEPSTYMMVDLPGEDRFTVKTDSKGEFFLGGLPDHSKVTIELLDPRYVTVSQFGDNVGESLTPITAQPGATISGKLVYDGAGPAAGVGVFAQAVGVGGGWAQATTDSSGDFDLTGLSTGAYNVMADFGDSPQWVAPAAAGIAATQGAVVSVPDMVATHGAIVTGVVTDTDTGAPVPGVYIGCYGPQRPSSSAAIISAKTDAKGAYSLRVVPGANSVYVSGAPDNYITAQGTPMTDVAVSTAGAQQVDFKLKAGLIVSGIAVDPDGKPVAGALLSLSQNTTNGPMSYDFPQSSTIADGSFTFSKLSPGPYTVHVAGSWDVTSPNDIQVPASGPVTVTLTPVHLANLVGKTIDQSGKPISGVTVDFMVMTPIGNGMSNGNDMIEHSDDNGAFTLPDLRPDNQVTATITKNGYAVVSGGQVTSSNGKFTISDIVMAPLDATASGVICDDSGAPVVGAWVIAASTGGSKQPIKTDARGRFTLTDMTPGQVDIVAAKGDSHGSGTLTAEVPVIATSSNKTGPSITIEPAKLLKSADQEQGYTILSGLLKECSSGNYYAADAVDAEIGAYDPDGAVRLLTDSGQTVSDTALMQIIEQRAQVDPHDAAVWGYPRILKMQDPGARGESAVMLGTMLARSDPSTALALYAIAKDSAAIPAGGQFSQYVSLQIPALAAELGRPEAQSLLDTAIAECLKQPRSSDSPPQMELLAMFMTAANPAMAQEVVDKLPDDERSRAQQDAVNAVLQGNSAGVVDLADKMAASSPTDFDFGKVAEAAIEQIGKSDPQAALRLAQSVQAPYYEGVVLADAADFAPLALAADLYRKASALSASTDSRSSPAMIAAKAWTRDKALGSDLFANALKLCSSDATSTSPSEQSVADFAFYYARVDPAFSRVMLEKQYAVDSASTEENRSYGMESDALAMSAVDVDRALQMAYAIDDINHRLDGVRKIAQYVLATTSIRSTMPFDRWKASDTWTPGTPTEW